MQMKHRIILIMQQRPILGSRFILQFVQRRVELIYDLEN